MKRIVKKSVSNSIENEDGMAFREFVLGAIVLTAGLFPYVVVRHAPYISIVGFDGRDSILVPFGLAMLIDSFLRIICKKEGKVILITFFMIVGFWHFNSRYSYYQADTYWGKGFQECLRDNSFLKDYHTIYVVENSGTRNYYIYNGIFEEVYGDENRLVFGVHDTVDFDTMRVMGGEIGTIIEREWYNMKDYDSETAGIDAIILYSNSITPRKALLMRISEIFNRDIKGELLENALFQVIYPEDEAFEAYMP